MDEIRLLEGMTVTEIVPLYAEQHDVYKKPVSTGFYVTLTSANGNKMYVTFKTDQADTVKGEPCLKMKILARRTKR